MRRSERRIRGRGEQVIRIMACEMRDLAELPDEIEILGVIVENPTVASCWVPDQNQSDRYVYVHITSFWAVRRPARSPLCIEDFESFLERYHACVKTTMESR